MSMATFFSPRSVLLRRSYELPFLPNKLALPNISSDKKYLHISPITRGFLHEDDPKSGYIQNRPTLTTKESIRQGLKLMKEEIQLWKSEVKSAWELEHILKGIPGTVDKLFEFKTEQDLSNWIVTSDKDNDEGQSTCQLTSTAGGKGLFSGNLCFDVPKDGVIKKTGYCNIRSLRKRKSFMRDSHYEWGMYNTLVMRVRGDGRSYALHLSTSDYFDMSWNDIFTYVLFTRGGPYWQYTRIPFSKFFFTSKGRIQDIQESIPLHQVASLGITMAERTPGPFSLEIDYIGLEYDPVHKEEFAYEMYKVGTGIANT